MFRLILCFGSLGVCLCWAHSAALAQEKTGTLSGRILYDGEPPPLPALEVPTTRSTQAGEKIESVEFKKYAGLGLKDESLVVSQERGLKNAIIWISDKSVPIPKLPVYKRKPDPVKLAFAAGKLEPQVLAWWAPDRELKLDNQEPFAINLRSDAYHSQQFNRVLPPKESVVFPQAAEPRPVYVRSDVFHWLPPAIVFPCAHPYFAVTDDEGRFTIKKLPPGTWEFTTWHRRSGWLRPTDWPKGRFTREIKGGEQDLGEVKVPKELFEK